jgi:hypothetical protein
MKILTGGWLWYRRSCLDCNYMREVSYEHVSLVGASCVAAEIVNKRGTYFTEISHWWGVVVQG